LLPCCLQALPLALAQINALVTESAKTMTFAHAIKIGKALTAPCERAPTETLGRSTLRIPTLMKNAPEQVSAIERLASASASPGFPVMHANAVS